MIKLSNIQKSYKLGKNSLHVLKGINLEIKEGEMVAIMCSSGSGKSTLLNFLAGRDAAITSNISGTTRDIIEVKLDLRGLPVTILDTAGIRESVDAIEEIGISRALERSSLCDLRIVLSEDGNYPPGLMQKKQI